jgi:hypothetical protein
MPKPPAELEDLGFNESEDLDAEDTALFEADDGSVQELIVLVEIEHNGRAYAVLATREQLAEELDGELMVAELVDERGARRCRPVSDDGALAAVRAALGDLIELSDEPTAEA